MTRKDEALILPVEVVERRIYSIRGQKVMLSPDLADLYRVETRALVQAVKRNMDRFPRDFMFQLTTKELALLKSQIVISSWGGTRRGTPYAFTEHGVLMLSSVLPEQTGCTGQCRDRAHIRQAPGDSCDAQGPGAKA